MALYTETMAAPAEFELDDDFDPLRAFHGRWNTALAERYLPIEELGLSRYECLKGRLHLAPAEISSNSWGAGSLYALMRPPALAAGLFAYLSINLGFAPDTWIQPDLAILCKVPSTKRRRTWVPVDHWTMPIEVISPSTEYRDRIDKPALCAAAGIPFFMHVKIDPDRRQVEVTLLRHDGEEYQVAVKVSAGETFEMTEPFPLAFDPAVLLEP